LLKEKIRDIIFGPPPRGLDRTQGASEIHVNGNGSAAGAAPAGWERHSHGLEQFFGAVGTQGGLSILDLGEINQTKVSFITDLGHKLYSEDFLYALNRHFTNNEALHAHADSSQVEAFLDDTLGFPPGQFDGVMVWDTLEYLPRPLMGVVVERLLRILRPRGCMLALFHTEEKSPSVPLYSFRIADAGTLVLHPKGQRRPAQHFNNRAIEKLFQEFRSVKFFLTRDQLREVIVRR